MVRRWRLVISVKRKLATGSARVSWVSRMSRVRIRVAWNSGIYIEVERRSLADELSLSCARPAADG